MSDEVYGVPDEEHPELTAEQAARGISSRLRRRLMQGEIRCGADIAALRRFVGLSQPRFAAAIGVSVHTVRNWEQGRRRPEGPAVALFRIAARHPQWLLEAVPPPGGDGRRGVEGK